MRKSSSSVLAIFALLLARAYASGQVPVGLSSKVDQLMSAYAGRQDFSGAVLIAAKGKVLFKKAYGMADYGLGVQNTTQTRFRIASISKQFTAAAILLLEQRGQLGTQDPLSKFVPGFPRGDQITIHHLLTHTSGISGDMSTLPEIAHDPESFHSPAELMEMLKKAGPFDEPGVKTRYSNCNYVLLASIIEKVSGSRYGDFLRRNIFEPLGMRDSGDEGYHEVVKDLATGYEPALQGVEHTPADDVWNSVGAGSIYSTVEDLYKWDQALYSDKLLTAAARRKMFTPALPSDYGYGWGIRERVGHQVIAHNGRSPGFMGDISRYVDDHATVIFLSNLGSGAMDGLRDGLAAVLFDRNPSEPPQVASVHLDPAALDPYVGLYEMFPGSNLTVRKVNDHLVLKAEGTPYSVLAPQSESTFFMRALYATVIFQKDQAGKVTGLIWRQDGEDSPARKIQ